MDNDMGNRIRQLRKEFGLTQQEFAGKIGTISNVLTNYETGKRTPTSSTVDNICKTFNVNEAWLRSGEGEMFRKLSREEEIEQMAQTLLAEESDSFRTRLVSVLVKLSPEKLEVLAEIAQKLVEGQGPAAPAGVDPEEAELQRRLADYERELREEQEARRRSAASPDTSETA